MNPEKIMRFAVYQHHNFINDNDIEPTHVFIDKSLITMLLSEYALIRSPVRKMEYLFSAKIIPVDEPNVLEFAKITKFEEE